MAGPTGVCAHGWCRPKLGLKHVRWERAALVTDVDWMRHLSGAFGWLVPGDLRTFAVAELDHAKAWVAEGEGPTSA
jgi:SpoIIAA-like